MTIANLDGAPWRDPKFQISDNQALAIANGWRKFVDDNALDFQATEVRLVNDQLRMAGSADRVALVMKTTWFGDELIPAGTVVIVDIKTSKLYPDANGLPAFWHSYAIQLYAYASSVPYLTETDTRGEWPFNVDQHVGLIAHLDMDRLLDDGEAVWQLIRVDLDVGKQGVEAVQAAEAYAEAPKFMMPDTVTVTPVGEAPAAVEPQVEPVDRREALHARYIDLCDTDRAKFVALGVDMSDLDAVEAALDSIDPFARQPTPVERPPANVVPVERLEPADDTSGTVTDSDIARLENHYRALEPAGREWVGHIARAAQQARAGLNLHEKPTYRRLYLMAGLIDWANTYGPDAGDIFAAVLEYVHGSPIPATINHGEVIASFDVDRALVFADTVCDLIDGHVHAIYGDDGRCTITRQPAT